MKLVLSVSAIGDQAEGRCPWMWIDLGPRLAQKALERIDVFRLAEEKDDDVIELYYVSLEGIFFNPWLAAVETEQEREGIAIETLLEQRCADAREWTEVPDELTIPEWAMVRTEGSQMIVRKYGVAFVASPRGTAAFVGTAEVPLEVLQRASKRPR